MYKFLCFCTFVQNINHLTNINMNSEYRYQLERYRGRGTRHICPQCGRKYTFTRYIDTNNNMYVNERVGKCNRLDKRGYHYTPREYFEDNQWLRDNNCSFVRNSRKTNERTTERPDQQPEPPKPVGRLPLCIKLLNLSNKVTILPTGSVTAVVSIVADV